MTEAKSTRPTQSGTKKRKKNDDLGDDKVTVEPVNPPPIDGKPPGYCEDPPKHKGL
jgi:hypothetical protein